MTDHRDPDATRANPAPPGVDDSDAETAAAPVVPTEPVTVADSLAWSQEETTPDDLVPYSGAHPYGPEPGAQRPTGATAAPDLKARLWRRLPQIAFGVCAAAALAAVGGAAIALTSASHTGNSGPATHSPANTPPPQSPATAVPPPPEPTTAAPAPPPTHSRVTVTRTVPPSPTNEQSTIAPAPPPPPDTPPVQTPAPQTDTPTPASPAAPPMTTSYVRVPFVPVPIPIQVPSNPNQPPQNPYYPGQYGPP